MKEGRNSLSPCRRRISPSKIQSMDSSAPIPPRKRCWETHAILCMVLFIVAIPLKPNRILELELFQYGAIGGVAMLLVGLFRRNPVAWWASVFLFGFLVIATACTT